MLDFVMYLLCFLFLFFTRLSCYLSFKCIQTLIGGERRGVRGFLSSQEARATSRQSVKSSNQSRKMYTNHNIECIILNIFNNLLLILFTLELHLGLTARIMRLISTNILLNLLANLLFIYIFTMITFIQLSPLIYVLLFANI